jgi:hypothetical protein
LKRQIYARRNFCAPQGLHSIADVFPASRDRTSDEITLDEVERIAI